MEYLSRILVNYPCHKLILVLARRRRNMTEEWRHFRSEACQNVKPHKQIHCGTTVAPFMTRKRLRGHLLEDPKFILKFSLNPSSKMQRSLVPRHIGQSLADRFTQDWIQRDSPNAEEADNLLHKRKDAFLDKFV